MKKCCWGCKNYDSFACVCHVKGVQIDHLSKCDLFDNGIEDKIKSIIQKHYGLILEELDELINSDDVEISIKIKCPEFEGKLG